MSRATTSSRQALSLLAEGIPDLSSSAENFLRHRPQDARMAVVVALEAAAAQYKAQDGGASLEVPKMLERFTVHRPRGADIIGVSQAAGRLEVSRTTVYDWVARKTLLAWKSTKRGLRIPAAQILAPGKVAPGLAEVLAIVEDPELAWAFLIQEWPFADEVAIPLEKLMAGQIKEVLDAAPGFGTAYT